MFLFFLKLLIGLASFLALFDLTTALSIAEADSSNRPPPPRRIPPNKVKPGGGLDFSYLSCDPNNESESLVALVPVDNPVLTAKAYPSFLFYISDSPAAISHGEFSVLTADEKERIYRVSLPLDRTPGILKIDLPAVEEYALESGNKYHWYFKVYCQDSPTTARFLDVDGWIERVPLTPEIESKIDNSSPDIWYDAIAKEAEKIAIDSQSILSRDRWRELMKHIDREYLTEIKLPINNISDPALEEPVSNSQ